MKNQTTCITKLFDDRIDRIDWIRRREERAIFTVRHFEGSKWKRLIEQFNPKICDDRPAFQVGRRYKSLRRLISIAQSHQDSSWLDVPHKMKFQVSVAFTIFHFYKNEFDFINLRLHFHSERCWSFTAIRSRGRHRQRSLISVTNLLLHTRWWNLLDCP